MKASDEALILHLVGSARADGREFLLEPEALVAARVLGLGTPRHVVVRDDSAAARVDLGQFQGNRVVVKVVSPEILHKTDVGGVVVVRREAAAVAEAIGRMRRGLAERRIVGFMVSEFVEYDGTLGGELLLGMRQTADFGPVVTLGGGGVTTEFLATSLRPGRELAILSPKFDGATELRAALGRNTVAAVALGHVRRMKPRIEAGRLEDLLRRCARFAARFMPEEIAEFEINPVALTDDGPVALDALLKLGRPQAPIPPPRPLEKLRCLLRPRSVAVIGVSEKLNPGHIIVNNLIREGFSRDRIRIVKPGHDRLEDCVCVPDLAALPERVDLLIVSVDAEQVPGVVEEVIASRKAESLIVIPGGLGEVSGTEDRAARLRTALDRARTSDWRGPLINGGNCLGIRSRPGSYDTMFIPERKLPPARGEVAPLAVISQSGAFAVALASRFTALNPRFLVSIGNQIDLTLGDYLTYLADDPDVAVFACYVEGFRPLDGLAWLEAAARITASGRPVVLYRAGRTPEGAQATASHTASIAGDYAVTRELAATAGVLVAESLQDFEDLTRLCCLLRGKRIDGVRLGAVTNAGFECVAIADNLGRLRLGPFTDATVRRLGDVFARARIAGIVEPHNPLDLTPMAADEAYEESIRAVLADPLVDVGVVGCVPLTPALNTLPAAAEHREDLARAESIASRMIRILAAEPKAWVAVVHAGPLYEPLVARLEAGGVPTFPTADRAVRLLEAYCGWRLRSRSGADSD